MTPARATRLLAPALWLAIAIAGGAFALRFPAAPNQPLGPAFMPLLLAGALGVLALVLAVQTLRAAPPATEAAPETTPQKPATADSPLAILALLVAYVFLLPVLGFISASALLFAAALRLFGYPNLVRAFALGLVLAFALHLVFARLMGVPLPAGHLG